MRRILFLIFILAGLTSAAVAQQTGNIVGQVRDESGAVIPSANITLTNNATASKRTVQSNEDGEYNASSLEPGAYTIDVDKAGFQKLSRSGVILTTASTLNVDLQMQVGSDTQTISVTTQASQLESQTGTVSNLVDSKQIVDMPLVTRNFTDLVLLTPGAHTGSSSNLAEGGSAYSIRGGADYSVNGSIAAANAYLIDGLYDKNQWLNTLVMVPIVDSIAEYRVMTSNFGAEYGEAAGAVTTVTTKSGSNEFHGAVWEFLRNTVGNANTYFANHSDVPRAPYHRNMFGGNIGGPIFKDRTFFFGDYQGIRQSTPVTATSTIPTATQVNMVETGNFSALGVQLYNPYSGSATARLPFANNNVSAYLDPAAVKLISLLPAPTNSAATNNYTISAPSTLNDDQFDVRIDQNLAAADRLFFKYSFDKPNLVSPGTIYPAANSSIDVGPYLATGGNGFSTAVQTQSGTLGYTHVFSPSLLLEAHAGIIRWYANVNPLGINYNAASELGIPGINYNSLSGGLPAFTISGISSLGDSSSYPEQSRITTFQYDGDIIKTVNTHTFKAGALFLRHRFNGYSAFPTRGTFDFNGQFTSQIGASNAASSLADFAIGAEDSASRNILDGEFGMRYFQIAGYAQDSWRLTDRLTLEYGARYEVSVPPHEVHNHWANVDIATGLLEVAGINGNGSRLRDTDFNTFGPRVGFAYTLDRARKTVVRGGFGMSYVDTLIGGTQLYKNLPYYFAQTVVTTSTAAPPTTLSEGMPTPVAPDPNDVAAISVGSPTAWNMHTRETGIAQYSLGVERSFAGNTIAGVSYVGTRSEHLMINSLNLDQSRPGSGAQGPREPYYTINPNLTALHYLTSAGDSHYDSLQVHVGKHLSGGLSFDVAYTFANYLSDAGNPNSGGNSDIQDSQCLSCNYGPTPDDYRHTLVINHVYELPFGKDRKYLNTGWVSGLAGPWNFSGIWTLYSGGRFTPIYGTNVSNSTGGGDQRPDRIGIGNLSTGRSIEHWFNTADFVAPQAYTFGNSGTGILTGPGYFNVNLTLERHLIVRNRFDLDFRGEAFNAFNRANFSNPNATIGTSSAGIISSTSAARILQVALKASF